MRTPERHCGQTPFEGSTAFMTGPPQQQQNRLPPTIVAGTEMASTSSHVCNKDIGLFIASSFRTSHT
jgi:hypothetical protein